MAKNPGLRNQRAPSRADRDTAANGSGEWPKSAAAAAKKKKPKDADRESAESVLALKQRLSGIRNKLRRQEAYQKVRQAERRAKEELRRRRDDGDAPRPTSEPHTLESLRLPDATMTGPEGDAEVDAEEAADEFADILDRGSRAPRLLVTHANEVSRRTDGFCRCLASCVPGAVFHRRRRLPLAKVVAAARARDFTAVLIVGEHNKKPCTALLTHLPSGPTLTFRLSSVRLPRELARPPEDDKPETVAPQVLCNRFHTRLGRRVARGLAALFPGAPAASGGGARAVRKHARVVTFHNQRDYVFFRHHRYLLKQPRPDAASQKPRLALQEVGPRFTLKLRALMSGPLGGRGDATGVYEWLHKRHEMEQSRRRFFL